MPPKRIGSTSSILIADQLHEMGFRHMNAHSLKPKHVEKLVERWLAEKLSPGTIKNRMSALRWWAEKIGKENIIARTNAAYGIPDRVYVTNISKAKELAMDQLQQIRTLCIRISLRLQAAFGLRREESIKIVPKWADRGDRSCSRIPGPRADGSARSRSAPRNSGNSSTRPRPWPRARAWSRPAIRPIATICALPLRVRAGRDHAFHGHRHFYAQARYKELTGWECPARGGPRSKQLTPKQKAIDREAREVISREMGHGREQVTRHLLGSIGYYIRLRP